MMGAVQVPPEAASCVMLQPVGSATKNNAC